MTPLRGAAASAQRGRARRPALVLATAFVLAAGLACATPPEAPEPSDAERQAYAEAVGLLARDAEAGAEALRAFAEAHPASPLAADARLRLAERAVRAERVDEALGELRRILRRQPEAPASDRARLLTAQLERSRGRPEAAYAAARELRLPLLDAETRKEAHRLLAELAGETERPVARVRWLARVRADQPNAEAAAEVDREIEATLAGMDADALARAAEGLGRRVPAARIRLAEATRRLRAGDVAGARDALDAATRLPLGPGDAERLAALEAAVEEGYLPGTLPGPVGPGASSEVDASAASGVLGVALPLTGPWAPFGEEALQGVLLAAGIYGAEGAPSGVLLEVRDTAGEPARAAAAARELAANEAVAAVVGPLLAEPATRAGAVAERAGLPFLALTRSEEAARGRRFVLHVGASPRVQTELVAHYATDELGLRRFAILYPEDDYGRRLRGIFWDAVEAGGGRVVGVARYAPDATDFAAPIRRLVGYELLTGGQEAALAERERLRKRAKRATPEEAKELREKANTLTGPGGGLLPPFVDFEAVFVPDTHENVALLAPHLAFHDIQGVRLLGLSGMHHPDLIAIGGEHVEGAVLTADYHGGSEAPRVVDFARRFREAFGKEPGFLAAEAFDATELAVRQLQEGRRDRAALAAGMRRVHAWPGVSGVIAVGPDGEVVKRSILLGVERGEFVAIEERGAPPRLPGAPSPTEAADADRP